MSCCPGKSERSSCCPPAPPAVASCFGRPLCASPLVDAMGPYPDEVIMTVLDRLLYYSGATQIYHQLTIAAMKAPLKELKSTCKLTAHPSPCSAPVHTGTKVSGTSISSVLGTLTKSSNTSQSKFCSASSKNPCNPITVCSSVPSSKTSCKSSQKCMPKCGMPPCGPPPCKPACRPPSAPPCRPSCGPPCGPPSCSPRPPCGKRPSCQPRTPRVDFANPVADTRRATGGQALSDCMKRSISGCSVAYHRLKSKLASNLCESDKTTLWTRLMRSDNGYHVYEVYKNKSNSPFYTSSSREPVVLFLVMPNGYVMPFEMLADQTKKPA